MPTKYVTYSQISRGPYRPPQSIRYLREKKKITERKKERAKKYGSTERAWDRMIGKEREREKEREKESESEKGKQNNSW